MDFRDSPEDASYRAELRAWLDDAVADLPGSEPATLEERLDYWRPFQRRLYGAGYAGLSWPRAYGGQEASLMQQAIFLEEYDRAGAPDRINMLGEGLAGPTIIDFGTDRQREGFLRPILEGSDVWCQLFSEPAAGSDLAALEARAHRERGGWRITGQKVWTSRAQIADYGMLLARTGGPRHGGITYFILPMRQPGVEVRPLRQMNGYASFNEVFLDRARVPAGNVIGEPGQGWTVALTTLAHERRLAAYPRPPTLRPPTGGLAGRAMREAAEESERAMAPYRWYPQRAGRPDLVIERAIAAGRDTDALVRQEIVKLITLAWSARWTAQRAAAARALGRPPGPEGSVAKLASSNIARAAARVHAMIAGPAGMLAGATDPSGEDGRAAGGRAGIISEIFLSVPAISIAGGTDQIQRTILAERILGLAKEPAADRGVAFRKVVTNG